MGIPGQSTYQQGLQSTYSSASSTQSDDVGSSRNSSYGLPTAAPQASSHFPRFETASRPLQLTYPNAPSSHHNSASFLSPSGITPILGAATANPGFRAHYSGFGHTQGGAVHNTVPADSGLSFNDMSGMPDDLNNSQRRIPDARTMSGSRISEAAHDSPQHGHQLSLIQLRYSAQMDNGNANYFQSHVGPPQRYVAHAREPQQHPASTSQLGHIANEAVTFPQEHMLSNDYAQRLQLPTQTRMPTLHSAKQAQSTD